MLRAADTFELVSRPILSAYRRFACSAHSAGSPSPKQPAAAVRSPNASPSSSGLRRLFPRVDRSGAGWVVMATLGRTRTTARLAPTCGQMSSGECSFGASQAARVARVARVARLTRLTRSVHKRASNSPGLLADCDMIGLDCGLSGLLASLALGVWLAGNT